MTIVEVNASKKYNIYIDRGILDKCGEYVKDVFSGSKVLIVSETNVAPLYLERAKKSLVDAGLDVYEYIFEAGEQSKNPSTLIGIVEYAAQNGFSRKDMFVALGGGVTGDICGFAAATYMRGVKFVQIPTTLLSCVDSSVGGKTAVDLEAGKNLFGAFWQPSAVLCDPDTLSTLTEEIFADGMAEVIKYGIIFDKDFFDKLAIKSLSIEEIIERCVSIKAEIVNQDEFDKGKRALLNLGHTFGHAIEKLSDFSISHGKGVAIGCCIATNTAYNIGVSSVNYVNQVCEVFDSFNLPTKIDYKPCDIANACKFDKKISKNAITFILPTEIGNAVEHKISYDILNHIVEEGMNY